MQMTKETPRAIRTQRGWAIHVLQEAGAIHECEEHGWAKDRADPHGRELAFDLARQDPPTGVSAAEAVAESARSWIRSATRARNVWTEIAETAPIANRGRIKPRAGISMGHGSWSGSYRLTKW
jgi:hypothetical protein